MNQVLRDGVINILKDKLQITYNELYDIVSKEGFGNGALDDAIAELEQEKAIAESKNGTIRTYYLLKSQDSPKKVLIVEDDKNINRLMAISIGKGFEITQIYDGGEAMGKVRAIKPDLVVLDLMLPHKDGLDICQTIKEDPDTKGTVVIIVSAMDPTSNRFKGIKYGADYYIRKPFNPSELRNLTTLFLSKKGKKFDPLIDLPNDQRISEEIERYVREGEKYTMGTIKVEGLSAYSSKFGEAQRAVILRLISQLMQDVINTEKRNAFIGFLNSDEFVIAGNSNEVASVVQSVTKEFEEVTPFILQDHGYKNAAIDFVENLFETGDIPKLSLIYEETHKQKLKEKREKILKERKVQNEKKEVGLYTYTELQKLLGRDDLDVSIKRDSQGVKLNIGKKNEDKKGEKN